ncbi:hypothetical protein RI367_002364 [Sorochytrium milnesiophthora]
MQSFFLELVPNLQTLSLAFPATVTTPQALNVTETSVGGVHMPVAIEPRSLAVSRDGPGNTPTYSWKYKHQPGTKKTQRPPASAQDVPLNCQQCLQATRIECKQCGASLVRPLQASDDSATDQSLFSKSLLLPSDHWQELIECWMCHEDTDTSIQPPSQQAVLARAGTCLVGISTLLVHASNISDGAVAPLAADGDDAAAQPPKRVLMDRWKPVCCSACRGVLGASPQDASAVDLVKSCIRVLAGPQRRRLDKPGALSVYLGAELLETKASHGTTRFIIADMATQVPALKIWLMSGDYKVQTAGLATLSALRAPDLAKLSAGSMEELQEFVECSALRHAVKVLYQVYPRDAERLRSPPVHHDTILHVDPQTVVQLLLLSTQTVPAHKRTAQGPMSVDAELAAIQRLKLSLFRRTANAVEQEQLQQQGLHTPGGGLMSSPSSLHGDDLFPRTIKSTPFHSAESILPSFVPRLDSGNNFSKMPQSRKAALLQSLRDIKRDHLVKSDAARARPAQNLDFLEKPAVSSRVSGNDGRLRDGTAANTAAASTQSPTRETGSSIYPAFEALLANMPDTDGGRQRLGASNSNAAAHTSSSSLLASLRPDRTPAFSQLAKYGATEPVPRDIRNALILQLNQHCKSNLHFRSFLQHVFDHIPSPPAALIREMIVACRQFRDMAMAYSVLAQLKHTGVMNYLSSATSRVFGELIRTSWALEQDVERLRLILAEMKSTGLDVDGSTVKILKEIKRQLEAQSTPVDKDDGADEAAAAAAAAQTLHEYWQMLLDMNLTQHFSSRRHNRRPSMEDLASTS